MGNKNSSNSKVHHGQIITRVASTESGYDPGMGRPVAKFRDEYIAKPMMAKTPSTSKGQHGTWVYSNNTPLDNDETFTTFIQHAKSKYKTTRTGSHISREKSFVASASTPDDEATASPRDNQNDQFSNFILNAKKKLRTTSSMRKNGSFKISG